MHPRVVVPLLLVPLLVTGCGATPTPAATDVAVRDAARTSPVVMGYALEGSARPATVTRDGDLVDTIGVSGVALTGRGGVTALSAQAAALRRAANRAGKPPVLLFSNYNNRLGDFDEPRAHRMLTSPRKRTACARALVRRAGGFRGVQIDLESLRPRDARGLVLFTRAVRPGAAEGADRLDGVHGEQQRAGTPPGATS